MCVMHAYLLAGQAGLQDRRLIPRAFGGIFRCSWLPACVATLRGANRWEGLFMEPDLVLSCMHGAYGEGPGNGVIYQNETRNEYLLKSVYTRRILPQFPSSICIFIYIYIYIYIGICIYICLCTYKHTYGCYSCCLSCPPQAKTLRFVLTAPAWAKLFDWSNGFSHSFYLHVSYTYTSTHTHVWPSYSWIFDLAYPLLPFFPCARFFGTSSPAPDLHREFE